MRLHVASGVSTSQEGNQDMLIARLDSNNDTFSIAYLCIGCEMRVR